MIRDLIATANLLDKKGLTKEADILDKLLVKMAQVAEENLEESEINPNDDLISAITTILDNLSSQPKTEENEKKMEMLSSLLEENL